MDSYIRGSYSHDHVIEVIIEDVSCLYYVFKRPGVDLFLKKVKDWYNLVIFTASLREYADPVIDWLDKDKNLFSRRLFRESCTPHSSGHFTKNLGLVDPDLSSVCLLDNSPVSFLLNPGLFTFTLENGIPISSWTPHTNSRDDDELAQLLPFLDALRFTDDVRSVLGLRGVVKV